MIINMKEIKKYLILTFTSTYVIWGIIVLYTQTNNKSFSSSFAMLILYIAGVISPAICAIAVQKKIMKKEEFKVFLKNIILPSNKLIWYVMSIMLIVFFKLFPFWVFGGIKKAKIYIILLQLPLFILIGGLEEIGWRGFLLPNLQKRFSAFKSTIITGIVWTVWHLPLFFIIGTYQELYSNFYTFFLNTLGFTFILSIVYNNTKSIFICIFCHASLNSLSGVFIINETLISASVMLLIGIITFFAFDFFSKNTKHKKEFVT